MRLRALSLTGTVIAMGFWLANLSLSHRVSAEETPLPFVFIPVIAADHCGQFIDAFDDPRNGWFSGFFDTLHAQVTSGEYRLTFTGKGAVWLVPGPVCERITYRAAVDARWVGAPGNFIGLLFEIDEVNNRAYLFAVNTDDRVWLVFDLHGNDMDVLVAPVANDAVLPGNAVNRLAVVRSDDTVFFSINGTPVGELRGANLGKPVIAGLAAASYTTQSAAEARFDNFLWEY